LPQNPHEALLAGLRDRIHGDILLSEIRLTVPPRPGYRMEGSGIAIINPPWPEMELVKMTGEIARALAPACGRVMADAVNLARA
jgi:23S rRNA A2030 N6-methylase RlmJ